MGMIVVLDVYHYSQRPWSQKALALVALVLFSQDNSERELDIPKKTVASFLRQQSEPLSVFCDGEITPLLTFG